jgi:D-methionine transport system ATP-binding protein
MISLKNLSKSYLLNHQSIAALTDINLTVKPKEIFGIIGRSGAGKSTLIRCVNLLERPSAGDVFIEAQCLTTLNAQALRKARQQMGMIFQHFNLLQSRTVVENIALPLELGGYSSLAIQKRVNALLALTALEKHAKQYPSQLSGGQKQRVAIARALANYPKILLCDEATSALDPRSTQDILALLRTIHQELGITILLITHEMDVVKSICDRVAVLHEGKIAEERKVIDLFTHPHSPIGKDLVNAACRMEIPRQLKEMLTEHATHPSGTLLKIAYHGASASEPIISHLIQQYHVTINILQGNIETIQDQVVGIIMIEIRGDRDNVEKSIAFFKQNSLEIEILGHV